MLIKILIFIIQFILIAIISIFIYEAGHAITALLGKGRFKIYIGKNNTDESSGGKPIFNTKYIAFYPKLYLGGYCQYRFPVPYKEKSKFYKVLLSLSGSLLQIIAATILFFVAGNRLAESDFLYYLIMVNLISAFINLIPHKRFGGMPSDGVTILKILKNRV